LNKLAAPEVSHSGILLEAIEHKGWASFKHQYVPRRWSEGSYL